MERAYQYFHDGQVWRLGEAVKIMAEMSLKDGEVKSIVTFLIYLTGRFQVMP